MIEINELGGRILDGVQQIGDQPPPLGADGAVDQGDGEGRLDHADRQQYPEDAVADTGDGGTVAQVLGGGGDTAGPGTHEESRPALMDGMKELVAVEGRVGQQEHRLVQGRQKPLGIGEFLPRTPVRRRR
ncbi:hypothetical protein OH779_02270 [Actinacidiphila glaucinigra]